MYFNWFESIEICFNVKTFGLILYSYYFIQILLLAINGTVVLTFEKTALKINFYFLISLQNQE